MGPLWSRRGSDRFHHITKRYTQPMIKDLDNAAFHARYNANLHCILATRYSRLDLSASCIAALTASGSAAAFAGGLGIVWQVLIGIAAFSSALRPVLRWSELYAKHSSLALAYQQLDWRIPSMTLEMAHEEIAKLSSLESPAEPLWWTKVEELAEKRTRSQLGYEPA